MQQSSSGTILIVGASRGLGLALAEEFARRGWRVIGTVRGTARTGLHQLAETSAGRIEVDMLDIDDPAQLAGLRARLAGRTIDILLVNAGVTTADPLARVGAVATPEYVAVMTTNTLGPMRVIEALSDLVPADGLIAAMSSGQGSITNNVAGQREVYRASKAALNMLVRSFAARAEQAGRATLLLAPGWVRTALGGDQAPYTLAETAPKLADIILAKRGSPGLSYLDRDGHTVPW